MKKFDHILCVSGSRYCTDRQPVWDALGLYAAKEVLVIHGAASGIDECAQIWCESFGQQSLPFPAPWYDKDGKLNRANGPRRNEAMLDTLKSLRWCGYDTLCIAFPGPDSVGTYRFIESAKAREFQPLIISVNK